MKRKTGFHDRYLCGSCRGRSLRVGVFAWWTRTAGRGARSALNLDEAEGNAARVPAATQRFFQALERYVRSLWSMNVRSLKVRNAGPFRGRGSVIGGGVDSLTARA